MKISEQKLKDVCLLGQGEKTCAFIVCGADGFECSKGTGIEPHIRLRLIEGTMKARGNNCEGLDALAALGEVDV